MTFDKDEARVGVYFKLKAGDGGMQMQYALDRKGNQLVVRGLTGVGPGPHGPGTSATAPGAAPALPPNHPKIDGNGTPQPAGALPPGHPQVGSKQ